MEREPGDSSEQKEAETWLLKRYSKNLGISLEKKRFYPSEGCWVEIDGFCESPRILCEAWAHIGPPKSAQKNKVMSDAMRLLYIDKFLGGVQKRVLLFADSGVAEHFKGNSWMAHCLSDNDIIVEILELPYELKTRVLEAQRRQYR